MWALRTVTLAIAPLALQACSTPAPTHPRSESSEQHAVGLDDPESIVLSRQSIDRRLRAAESLDPRQDGAWRVLSVPAWSANEPTRLRLALLQRLHQANADRFWNDAIANWRYESNREVDRLLVDASRDAGESAAAALLLRWADREPLQYPRERLAYRTHWLAAQSALPPDGLGGEASARLFAWLDSNRPWAWRVAAWRVLANWYEHRSLEAALIAHAKEGEANALLLDLRAVVGVLGALPTRGWELYTLRAMRSDRDARGDSAWQNFAALAVRFTPDERRHLSMRHAAWVTRATTIDKPALSHDQAFDDASNQIDARVARWLQQGLLSPLTTNELFAQADADHADPSSEHGGLVLLSDAGGPVFTAYPPVERRHDRAYFAPPSLSLDLGRAVATYHFHAERHRNGKYTGPGFGDRRAVEASATNMLVFTFLDRDTLAVQMASPGEQLFDLGVIRRP